MVSPLEEVALKDSRDADNSISIGDSTLRSILPPHLNKIYEHYKVMCGCELCISAKSINSSYISWRDHYLRELKNLSKNAQNRRSGEKSNRLFETYKNSVMPHGCHIYETAADTTMAKICTYPPSQHAFPQWKCVLCCCSNFPRIDLPCQ